MKLDRGYKILIIVGILFICVLFVSATIKQEKISKANVEIETKDYIFYSYKETMKINPDYLCISFYDISKEYNIEHCGEFTVRYIK